MRPIRGAAGRFWLRKKKKILSRIQIISTPYGVQQQDESDELSSEKDSSMRLADDTHVIPDSALNLLPYDGLAWFLWKKFHFRAAYALEVAHAVRDFQRPEIQTCISGLSEGKHRFFCPRCMVHGPDEEDGAAAMRGLKNHLLDMHFESDVRHT